MKNEIICGDILSVLKTLPDNSVDAVITDPPYGLSFMGKKWDYDVPSEEIWRECLRVLKPGGYLLAFAGTRTQHRMAVRIEDAGFEIRDMIAWVYGSGFPKSLNISKMIDKKPEVLITKKFKNWIGEQIDKCGKTSKQINDECGFTASSYRKTDGKDYWSSNFPTQEKWLKMKEIIGFSDEYDFVIRDNINERGFVEPTGNLHKGSGNSIQFSGKQLSDNPIEYTAKQWKGWGTALKPALEPITVARKPLSEKTVAENCLKWGVGGINIDECRVGTEEEITNHSRGSESAISKGKYGDSKGQETHQTNGQTHGRFPANFIHDGSEEVLSLFPETKTHGGGTGKFGGVFGNGKDITDKTALERYKSDSGSASRFFYCAKASKSERNKGLEGMEEVIRSDRNAIENIGANNPRNRTGTAKQNHHPTVKPIKLMEYLVKLVSRENAKVLDPFAGSGTTGIACMKLNRNFIGIELSEEYCEIARKRIGSVELRLGI